MKIFFGLAFSKSHDLSITYIGCFDLAVVHKRFWVTSKLFDIEIIDTNNYFNCPKVSECDLMNIISKRVTCRF